MDSAGVSLRQWVRRAGARSGTYARGLADGMDITFRLAGKALLMTEADAERMLEHYRRRRGKAVEHASGTGRRKVDR